MSLGASPGATLLCVEKVVHVLYRAILVGGATTLITRCGVISWIAQMEKFKACDKLLLKSLDSKLRENCDQEKLVAWTGALQLKGKRKTESNVVEKVVDRLDDD